MMIMPRMVCLEKFLDAVVEADGDTLEINRQRFAQFGNPSKQLTAAGNDLDSFLTGTCGIKTRGSTE